jgi:hypothetical protein
VEAALYTELIVASSDLNSLQPDGCQRMGGTDKRIETDSPVHGAAHPLYPLTIAIRFPSGRMAVNGWGNGGTDKRIETDSPGHGAAHPLYPLIR